MCTLECADRVESSRYWGASRWVEAEGGIVAELGRELAELVVVALEGALVGALEGILLG